MNRSLDNRLRRLAGHRARDFRYELGSDHRREEFPEWEAAEEIERLSAENSVLREGLEDFISQIADCQSHHTVCGQFPSLAKAIQENLASVSTQQSVLQDRTDSEHTQNIGESTDNVGLSAEAPIDDAQQCPCPSCHGYGWYEASPVSGYVPEQVECEDCDGTGSVNTQQCQHLGSRTEYRSGIEECDECGERVDSQQDKNTDTC